MSDQDDKIIKLYFDRKTRKQLFRIARKSGHSGSEIIRHLILSTARPEVQEFLRIHEWRYDNA